MVQNHLKIALRHLLKHKGYAFVNIAGLAVGMACSMLILLWVLDEWSYDRFHEKADRIVRVCAKGRIGDTVIDQTSTCAPLPRALMMEFPEVEQAVRLLKGNAPVQYGERVFIESNILIADSTFFDVFSFTLLRGDPKTALSSPDACVITPTMARKYFDDSDPMDKILTVAGALKFRVAGIVKEAPKNSHFHFDGIFSLGATGMGDNTGWMSNSFATYLVLRDHYPYKALEAKFPDFMRRHYGPDELKLISSAGNKWEYYLQPLTAIHLNSHITSELEPNGNKTYTTFFLVIAAFILCIASINFMNLATAKSSLRSKEVGMRKVSGAARSQLVVQFLTESVLTSLIAGVLALGIVELAMPALNNLTGKTLDVGSLATGITVPLLLALILIVGFFSGSYPAFFLSSFRPITALKGQLSEHAKKSRLRNGLVLFQFTITIVLFIGTLIVHKQLVYLQDENLGFEKENVLVVRNYTGIPNAFKDELKEFPDVVRVAGAETLPGFPFRNQVVTPEQWKDITLNFNACDYDFLETLGMRMAQGRFFSREFGADTSAIVINEAAAKLLGWKDPIGKIIRYFGRQLTVIGEIRDCHYESRLQKIRPMGILLLGSPGSGTVENAIAVRIRTENVSGTISAVKKVWDRYAQGTPFDYSFLDDDYDNLYRNEMQTEKVFAVFSCLAIAIACLGLLGLSAFAAERRTKEIGVRKVLGASVPNLIGLLSSEFTKWVLLANVIAWPIAYYAMNNWLQNFAYRIPINVWVFLSAGTVALAIALLTVGFQAAKAATANPVESLRYE